MNEDENSDLSQWIDRAVKMLFREHTTIVTRLAGLNVAAEDIRVADPNLNLPELRADHVFVLATGCRNAKRKARRGELPGAKRRGRGR